jgi:hypothetical protein
MRSERLAHAWQLRTGNAYAPGATGIRRRAAGRGDAGLPSFGLVTLIARGSAAGLSLIVVYVVPLLTFDGGSAGGARRSVLMTTDRATPDAAKDPLQTTGSVIRRA